jgi:hypothetical protein
VLSHGIARADAMDCFFSVIVEEYSNADHAEMRMTGHLPLEKQHLCHNGGGPGQSVQIFDAK